MILHISFPSDWEKARKEGEYHHESLDNEGFIHCSTVKQTVQTANNFFKEHDDLVLLVIDDKKLTSPVKYEDPAGKGAHDPDKGLLFPHVYGPINLESVEKAVPFIKNQEGNFELPEEISIMKSGS